MPRALPSGQAHANCAKLTNVPYKRFVEIGEGTHTIMREKNLPRSDEFP
jgi:hypothetical protein